MSSTFQHPVNNFATTLASSHVAADGQLGAVVEAHAVGVDQLALLRHVRTKDMGERRVHQVGGGVVGPGAQAALRVDGQPQDAESCGQPGGQCAQVAQRRASCP